MNREIYEFMETPVLKLLLLPLKIVGMLVLMGLARLLYDKNKVKNGEKITLALVMTRVIMQAAVLFPVFYVLRLHLGWSEDLSIMVSGSLTFAYRETMDTWLDLVRKPLKIKDMLLFKSFKVPEDEDTTSDTDIKTVDPTGDEYPDDGE